jgi:hypothetical protein
MKCLVAKIGFDPIVAMTNEFRWNLHVNGKFSAYSIYRALIQPDVLADNDKKI